jgi:hypothetical protein
MTLPKDYLFSPFVLKAQQDAKSKGRKTVSYNPNGVSPDITELLGKSNVFVDYTGMYQNYMFNATEAAKSFNYVRPDRIDSRPSLITKYYENGGDTLDKLETYYDVEDGFNVAGAVMIDEAKAKAGSRRRK